MTDTGQTARKIGSGDNADALPLFASAAVFCPRTPLPDMQSLTRFPHLVDLLETRPMQRLRRIGFLGALDRIRSRHWYSRLEHSIGVAHLALLYADLRDLSHHDTRLLTAAGLLHDVGHGPLSHSLEPVFRAYFGISHHDAGRSTIRGLSPLGNEIPTVLTRHGVDVEETIAMIDGQHDGPHAFLFSSPINLDTIEGMTRCYSFFDRNSQTPIRASEIVRRIATDSIFPTDITDNFWQLKHHVYAGLIHSPRNFFYDALAQASMVEDIGGFSEKDFFKDDEQLRRGKRTLFKYIDIARRTPDRLPNELSQFILSYELNIRTRRFDIDTSVEILGPSDLSRRYVQEKFSRRITISNLLDNMG